MESPHNPIAGVGTTHRPVTNILAIWSIDGTNLCRLVSAPKFIFACASTTTLQGLAGGVAGIAWLGQSNLDSPPLELAAIFGLSKKFALYLSPSSGSAGEVFFGDGLYVMSSSSGKTNISEILTFTPLILNHGNLVGGFTDEPSAEYFIGVKAVRVDDEAMALNASRLVFDRIGFGWTKISNVHLYTVFERLIYRALVGAFTKALGTEAHRVNPMRPSGACFGSKGLAAVPPIDLMLQGKGVYWRIEGSNSMVRVSEDVLFLGCMDGGERPMTSNMIGSYQIEDNI